MDDDDPLDLRVDGVKARIFDDPALALRLDGESHLLTLPNYKDVTVDRFDVRLLLDDISGMVRKKKKDENADDRPEEEKAIDADRYLFLPPGDHSLEVPELASPTEPIGGTSWYTTVTPTATANGANHQPLDTPATDNSLFGASAPTVAHSTLSSPPPASPLSPLLASPVSQSRTSAWSTAAYEGGTIDFDSVVVPPYVPVVCQLACVSSPRAL
uniref:Suppressor of white apricot N-terminal domain-containing protein n=1 Tax=Eutreptiella gymnastica TaxID=73025 RepID=A0A7S1I750_9EUGL|mmetsp:Transcript_135500/g.235089  ORF Transcript_135500/g.235089 Transcript_135500/m.235089 type:complete len:214 (+) Transcript_135500:78-719(+)